ncbi:hypothetical protein YC2023_028614 [Brassica napus]
MNESELTTNEVVDCFRDRKTRDEEASDQKINCGIYVQNRYYHIKREVRQMVMVLFKRASSNPSQQIIIRNQGSMNASLLEILECYRKIRSIVYYGESMSIEDVIHAKPSSIDPDITWRDPSDNLVKTAHRKCGIKPEQVDVSDAALLFLIENYCREAGVRNLQKQIEKKIRKVSSLNIVQNFLTWMPSNLKLYCFINRLLLNLYANNFKSSAEGSIEMLHEYLRLKELE